MPKLLIFDAFTLLIREKTVANYALLRCKTFSLKIWVCKIFDKFHVCVILVFLQEQSIISCSAKNVLEATVFHTNDRKFLILSLFLSWQKWKTNTLHSFLPMFAISGSISREKKKFHIFQLSISLVGNWRQSLDLVLEAANNLKSDKFNFKFKRKSFRILCPRSLFLLQVICCQNKYIPHGKISGSASKWEKSMFSFNFLS